MRLEQQLEISPTYIQFKSYSLFQRNQNKICRSLTDLFKYAGQTCDQILELPLKQAQALLIQHAGEMRDDRKLAPNSMRQSFISYKDVGLPEVNVIFLSKISIITFDKWEF
jgi:hypothetical protein